MNKNFTLIQELRGGKSKVIWDSEVYIVVVQEGFSELIKSLSIVASIVNGQCWEG